jgi:hypothetical protein
MKKNLAKLFLYQEFRMPHAIPLTEIKEGFHFVPFSNQ